MNGTSILAAASLSDEVSRPPSDAVIIDARLQHRIARAKRIDRIMTGVFTAIGGFFLVLIVALAAYIVITGLASYYPGVLSFGPMGIGNQIFNTLYLVLLSLIVSVGLGLPAGIYMAEYAPDNKLTAFIRVAIESLSSLPSIVVGLFGYMAFVYLVELKANILAGALAVSILNLPLVTTETEAAIRSVPRAMAYGSAALGATHWRTIIRVLVPAGLPHVVTGVMLAAQRAFGEAAALLMTSGQGTAIDWSNWNPLYANSPLNFFRSGETLAVHVWIRRTTGQIPFLGFDSNANAAFTAAILVLIALFFSVAVNTITKRVHARQSGLVDKKASSKKEAAVPSSVHVPPNDAQRPGAHGQSRRSSDYDN
ncbi:MAG: phosphate ABC transporter permease PstA [Arcanobacterium sp.]|nr:phosphate ABC transporter permease PstA [Arcanobacterium sp.]